MIDLHVLLRPIGDRPWSFPPFVCRLCVCVLSPQVVMAMLRPVSSVYVLSFGVIESRVLIGVRMLGLWRVPPAHPTCARRFHSNAAFGVKDTVLGPLVVKLSCLMVGVWRYEISTNYSDVPSWLRFFPSIGADPRSTLRNLPRGCCLHPWDIRGLCVIEVHTYRFLTPVFAPPRTIRIRRRNRPFHTIRFLCMDRGFLFPTVVKDCAGLCFLFDARRTPGAAWHVFPKILAAVGAGCGDGCCYRFSKFLRSQSRCAIERIRNFLPVNLTANKRLGG